VSQNTVPGVGSPLVVAKVRVSVEFSDLGVAFEAGANVTSTVQVVAASVAVPATDPAAPHEG